MDEEQPVYRITVNGAIDPNWSDWLGALTIRTHPQPDGRCRSTLTGTIPDQPALRGILVKLWDLNLELLSVRRLR